MSDCEHCGKEFPSDAEVCPSCGEARAPDELLGSDVLGRYKLIKLIAEGGMGRVYLAEQAVGSVQRRVAVKVLHKQLGRDKHLMSRFAREAETLVRLTHPNTVQLFDFGALPDGTLALAMEYVEGHSLARELRTKGALTVARAERMLTQICGALQEAHANGIVHRDLKPDNLMLADRPGQDDFIKVLDFGIAKVADDASGERKNTRLTQQGMIIGTPPYMSPEQFSSEKIDARSDIYSLGIIAYEMLTGQLPFNANTPWEWASRHLTASPDQLRPDTARGLSASHAHAIDCALSKKADDRPQSVEAFLTLFTTRGTATLPLARTEVARPSVRPTAAAPTAEREEPSPPTTTDRSVVVPRSPGLAGYVFAAIGLAGIALVAWLALRRDAHEPTPAALPSAPVAVGATAVTPAPTPAPTLPDALPLGVSPPEQQAAAQESEPTRHRRREREDREPAEVAKKPRERSDVPLVTEPDEPTQAATPAREPTKPSPANEPTKPVVAKPSAAPPDLQQRIAEIQSSAASRPEVALARYQAAVGRYGTHPSLTAVRSQLAQAGEARVRQLISSGLCAQAQAIQRALRSTVGSTTPAGLFGPKCQAP